VIVTNGKVALRCVPGLPELDRDLIRRASNDFLVPLLVGRAFGIDQ
jgi:hypothetical protein